WFHELNVAWSHPGQSASDQRSANAGLWEAHHRAVGHLAAIDQILMGMEERGKNVNVYRRYFPAWVNIVFAYPQGWAGQGTAAIDNTTLAHLETLADRLDDYVPAADPAALASVSDYLTAVLRTLADDPSIPDDLRLHVIRVVRHAQSCVDEYALEGDFNLSEALDSLADVIARAERQSNEPGKWATLVGDWVNPFIVNVAATLAAAPVVQAIVGG
ncbi:MAG: hypothetical protein QM658_03265, partial [Gordonia sp. (in: high G+C Gram-positive bacteria)]